MNKRGFLGSTEVDVTNYWSAGKGSEELRCNETILYAEIDALQEEVTIAESQDEVQECYNKMDMFFMCLKAIDKYALDADLLHKAGVVIGNMVEAGDFSQSYASIEDENKAVDARVEEMYRRTEDYHETHVNDNFMMWYKDNVELYNYYNNFDGTQTIDKPHLSGLRGDETYDVNSAEVKKSGPYFLYVVADVTGDDAGKKKAQVRAKKAKHQEWMRDMANKSQSNMTYASIKAASRSGIMAPRAANPATQVGGFGAKPEVVVNDLKHGAKGGVAGLGFALTASMIVTIITVICAVLVKVLEVIIAYFNQRQQVERTRQTQIAQQMQAEQLAAQGYDVNGFMPSEDDWIDFNGDGIISEGEMQASNVLTSPWLWLGGAALVGTVLLLGSGDDDEDDDD